MTTNPPPPLLAATALGMAFGPVQVLRSIDFDLRAGEVHALAGENGAGKSTLMKILAGQIRPTAGTVRVRGEATDFAGVGEAQALGIVLIHQELNLATHLGVAANIFLGRELRRGPFLRSADMRAAAAGALAELGCRIDPARSVQNLSIAERQMVEIAKASSRALTVLLMDEPTAVLTGTETEALVRLVRRLTAQGVAVVYSSHKLLEVLALADRVTVLRDGARVATLPAAGLTEGELARLMVGRELAGLFPAKRPAPPAPPALAVAGVTVPGWVRDASFSVQPGEILGFAGLVGAGRTELMEGIVGLRPRAAGQITVAGRPVRIRTLRDAVRAGLAYLTEDRKGRGLLTRQPARPNLTLATLRRYGRLLVDKGAERAALARAVRRFDIRVADGAAPVSAYSGGNQQKLLLAKTMELLPDVLIVDEPTRGIDVGTKQQIYGILHALAAEGVAVVLVSSELAEVVGLAHRVVVMRRGAVAGVLEGDAISEDAIVRLAAGVGAGLDAGVDAGVDSVASAA